jgi:hypothetical protein
VKRYFEYLISVNELAAALEFMLNERTLWETYTIAARQKVEQYFDSNQQLLLQAKYYDELLGNRGMVLLLPHLLLLIFGFLL